MDYFWHSPDGWRYTKGGVKVGPFDRFADAVEDYYEPELPLLASIDRVVDVAVEIYCPRPASWMANGSHPRHPRCAAASD